MKVNEIFYSLQGEGHFTGTPAVFIRFSGCNLRCPFCDTSHAEAAEMTPEEIVAAASAYPARHAVLTGGEPSMQVTPQLVELLHRAGFYVQAETNGTLPLPRSIDWITCSPKSLPLAPGRIDELKIVYTGSLSTLNRLVSAAETAASLSTAATSSSDSSSSDSSLSETSLSETYSTITDYRLQPCDTGDPAESRRLLQETIDYIKSNPRWKLSLQTHKLINIP